MQLFDLSSQNMRSLERLSSQMSRLEAEHKQLLANQESLNKNQSTLNHNQLDCAQKLEALEDGGGSLSSSDESSTAPSKLKRLSMRVICRNIGWAVDEATSKLSNILFRSIFGNS